MLYALKYENDDKIAKMKDILRGMGLTQNSLNLINYIIDYAGKQSSLSSPLGKSKRAGDLFSDKNLLTKAQ